MIVVDASQQCYLVENGTYRQPRSSIRGSAVLRVGMRPHNTFEGMSVWGFGRSLDCWVPSSDDSQYPLFRLPARASQKNVSFLGQSGRWQLHRIAAFDINPDPEVENPSSLLLPLDEADIIQPNSNAGLCNERANCGLCGFLGYVKSWSKSYVRIANTDWELREPPFRCPRGCALGYTHFPRDEFDEFFLSSEEPQAQEMAGSLVDTEDCVLEGPESEKSIPIIPTMDGTNLKGFSWADDEDEDW